MQEIWQEIISSGTVNIAIDFYNNCETDNWMVKDRNLLKMLLDAPRDQIEEHNLFISMFVENLRSNAMLSPPDVWNCVSVLAKTSQWRKVAGEVLAGSIKIADDAEDEEEELPFFPDSKEDRKLRGCNPVLLKSRVSAMVLLIDRAKRDQDWDLVKKVQQPGDLPTS